MILDSGGQLKAEAKEIFKIAKEFDIVIANGHISPKETFALAEEAQKIGFKKLLITHALQGALTNVLCNNDQLRQLAAGGVYIEHSFWDLLPTMNSIDPAQIADLVETVGAEMCIMSTDLGQSYNLPAPEGMRLFIGTLLRKGLKKDQVEMMVKTNPAQLLGLN